MRSLAGMCLFGLGLALPAMAAETTSYSGLCEASAGVFIDDTHFAVASDETNILRIYQRGDTTVGVEADLVAFTYDKSDIEAAARVGDRVYWLSSHSLNSSGDDKPKRKVFFATKIVHGNSEPSLEGTGSVVSIREPLLAATGVKKSDLNIEGLAATPEGELLVGLRNTLAKEALIVPFHNPAAVVDDNATPDFGKPFLLNLDGKGIRSLELVGNRYLIVAGPVSDTGDFALYWWSGNDSHADPVDGTAFKSGLRPEAMMAIPGTSAVQILSDDGSKTCSDEKGPVGKRAFRSVDIAP